MVAVGVAAWTVGRSLGTKPTTPSSASPKPTKAPKPVEVKPVSATGFDPQGDDRSENPDTARLAIDSKSNKGLYGKSAPASDIIARRVSTDVDAARRFERAILASTAGRAPNAIANTGSAQTAPDPASAQGTDDAAAAPSPGATTFPMEDAQPGAEPPR